MLFSVGCEHAIRASVYLASDCPPGEVRQVKVISEALGLSQPTVAKVMHELVRRDLVRSNKGRGGGFFLGRDAVRIRLMDIVRGIDGTSRFERCVIGHADCSDETHCPLHETWVKQREQIVDYLETTSLKDLADKLNAMASAPECRTAAKAGALCSALRDVGRG